MGVIAGGVVDDPSDCQYRGEQVGEGSVEPVSVGMARVCQPRRSFAARRAIRALGTRAPAWQPTTNADRGWRAGKYG